MSRLRRALLVAAVLALAASAGCAGVFGGGGVDEDRINREADYDWETDANVTVRVLDGGNEYHAVYTFDNRTAIQAYTRGEIQGEQPVDVAAVRYRYPNGTVVRPNASALTVGQEGDRTVITPPERRGQVAYTAPATPKHVGFETPVSGSYEMVLPPSMRVEAFLFGSVVPGGYTTSVDDENRLHVRWENLDSGSLDVRYYLERDFYIFTGFAGLGAAAALVGVVYYRLQIRRLERRRQEVGLDVESGDDDL